MWARVRTTSSSSMIRPTAPMVLGQRWTTSSLGQVAHGRSRSPSTTRAMSVPGRTAKPNSMISTSSFLERLPVVVAGNRSILSHPNLPIRISRSTVAGSPMPPLSALQIPAMSAVERGTTIRTVSYPKPGFGPIRKPPAGCRKPACRRPDMPPPVSPSMARDTWALVLFPASVIPMISANTIRPRTPGHSAPATAADPASGPQASASAARAISPVATTTPRLIRTTYGNTRRL